MDANARLMSTETARQLAARQMRLQYSVSLCDAPICKVSISWLGNVSGYPGKDTLPSLQSQTVDNVERQHFHRVLAHIDFLAKETIDTFHSVFDFTLCLPPNSLPFGIFIQSQFTYPTCRTGLVFNISH